jgi:hypothetical protein
LANPDYNFDFGFSVVDETELEVLQQTKAELESTTEEALDVQERLHKLYNMIMPLLNNLAKNPEKDYIYWPNRLDKIEKFRDAIDTVYKGS